jgi:hypothetical protein
LRLRAPAGLDAEPPAACGDRPFSLLLSAISSHLADVGDLVEEGRLDDARAVLQIAVAIRGELYVD